ncbi:GTP-binding protein [Nocardia miyunensis]|uniref:GTP-binding protein n=1 Tax=Nocardia miyunensis TaxID=282684 RepID=UPI00082B3993|nr:ATP/GTP-binding protein [Nocardia miyunensis]
MAYATFDPNTGPGLAASVKILIAGGFGVGKTTTVAAVSEIAPLRTEEVVTEVSRTIDDLSGVESKTTTTVAMDFGRITISPELVLYIFGTPGQDRFWFMWDELALGALGAVVLADTRRLESSFAAVDYFERRGLPFVVGVNCFDGAPRYTPEEVRYALDLADHVAITLCDVRHRDSAKAVLVTLLEYLVGRTARHAGSENPPTAFDQTAGSQ